MTSSVISRVRSSGGLFRHPNPSCIPNSYHSPCSGDPEKHCPLVFWFASPCCFVWFSFEKHQRVSLAAKTIRLRDQPYRTYTFAFFNSPCTVYVKLPFYWTFQSIKERIAYHQHGRFYVGSTSITAAKRGYNRMAKLKQTLSDSAVHVELAIRYWASQPLDFEQ